MTNTTDTRISAQPWKCPRCGQRAAKTRARKVTVYDSYSGSFVDQTVCWECAHAGSSAPPLDSLSGGLCARQRTKKH